MNINYITGDATRPAGPGPHIIVHVCNDIGEWGRGFVVAPPAAGRNRNNVTDRGIAAS